MTVLLHPLKLRALIEEYGQLQRREGHTPQSRGQRFNGLIAELLQCWGIEAVANIRASGEIDVGFVFEGQRFIVEAKWERGPSDTGAIAKLQKRLRQRLAGTIGVFIAMAGFTEEALHDLKQGEQLGVLCLTREHFEAMLSGFVPPPELIQLLVTRASLFGEAYVSTVSLVTAPAVNQLGIVFRAPDVLPKLVEDALPDVKARVVVSELPFGQSGLGVLREQQILLTLDSGIYSVDWGKRLITSYLTIPNCSRNVIVSATGGAYVARKVGVAYVQDNQLVFVGGGLVGNVSLSEGSDNVVWAFSNGQAMIHPPIQPSLTRLGKSLGEQAIFEVNYPPSAGTNSAQIDTDRFLIAGAAGVAIVQAGASPEYLTRDLVNPMGVARVSTDRFWIASDQVVVSEINVVTREVVQIVRFNLQGSVSELARYSGSAGLLFSHYSNEHGTTKGIVVLFET